MSRKFDLEEVKDKFLSFGLIPMFDKYENNTTPVLCKTKEGYLLNVRLNDLAGKTSPTSGIFRKNNPYTMSNIKLWLVLKNKNFVLQDNQIFMSCKKQKLIWVCPEHGEFESRFNDIQNGRGCPQCGEINRRENRKTHTEDTVLEIVKDKLDTKHEFQRIFRISGDALYVELLCTEHNKIWTPTINNIINGNSTGCILCRSEKMKISMKGKNSSENSYRWKGGVSTIQSYLRETVEMREWKRKSMEDCNFKCVVSGEAFDAVHHLYSFSDIVFEVFEELKYPIYKNVNQYTEKELRCLIDKCSELHEKYGYGVCLSKKYHDKFHARYGKGNNNKEQFDEFLKTTD